MYIRKNIPNFKCNYVERCKHVKSQATTVYFRLGKLRRVFAYVHMWWGIIGHVMVEAGNTVGTDGAPPQLNIKYTVNFIQILFYWFLWAVEFDKSTSVHFIVWPWLIKKDKMSSSFASNFCEKLKGFWRNTKINKNPTYKKIQLLSKYTPSNISCTE